MPKNCWFKIKIPNVECGINRQSGKVIAGVGTKSPNVKKLSLRRNDGSRTWGNLEASNIRFASVFFFLGF